MGVFSLVILAANLLVAVSAQATTNATCLSSFNWVYTLRHFTAIDYV
jgi:hypothetical protein